LPKSPRSPRITRAQIVAEARAWLGTPFHHQACLRGVGVDCAQMVIAVARAVGYVPEQFAVGGYAQRPEPGIILETLGQWCRQIALAEALPGDILVLRWERDPAHLAIVTETDPLRIIHCYAPRGKGGVVEHIVDDTWRWRIVSAWRLRNVR